MFINFSYLCGGSMIRTYNAWKSSRHISMRRTGWISFKLMPYFHYIKPSLKRVFSVYQFRHTTVFARYIFTDLAGRSQSYFYIFPLNWDIFSSMLVPPIHQSGIYS